MPRMKPIEAEVDGKTTTIECSHQNVFPPTVVYLTDIHGSAEQQRAEGVITEAEFHQYHTWLAVCGQSVMGDKCMKCPHCVYWAYDPRVKENRLKSVVPETVRAAPFYRKIHGI